MPWKYETLIAPLDFPLHKSAEELASDIEKIKEEQAPILTSKKQILKPRLTNFRKK